MNRTAFITSEKKLEYPMLVVDKEGDIGEALAKQLKDEAIVIYVSKKTPEVLENIVHVPFSKKTPTIPDNTYSHIFLIDQACEMPKELMEEFIKKAKKDDSSLSLVVGQTAVTGDILTNFINVYDKARLIITGEIFKTDAIYNPRTIINKFILQSAAQGRILIPGDGTKIINPICFDDVVQGILEASFGSDEKEKLVYLWPKHGITLLSLANLFKKKDPDLKIDFTNELKLKQNALIKAEEGKYILGEKYDLEDRIKRIDYSSILKTNPTKEEKPEIAHYGQKNNNIYSFKTLFALLIFLVLLPLLSTLLFSFFGVGSLVVVKNSLENSNLPVSKTFASLASGSFLVAQTSSTILVEEGNLIGQGESLGGIVSSISSGKEISICVLSLLDAADKFKAIIAGKSNNAAADFSGALVEVNNALYLYNQEEQKGLIPQSLINKLSDSLKIVSSTIDFWPDIFGFNGQRTYLILFQNNMELRPGGGFIGSYGILSVNKGMVTGFNIYDVYDADGQLKGHIEPPYPIRRYLPLIHWFLRDSNFNVDFSKGAIASAVFLNTEMHQSVDGVIGVDLSFVKNILSVVGSVNVPDYNQTVNAANFFQIAQAHAEDDFFPGSTQKKDFLRSFYNSLEAKISTEKDLPYVTLLQALSQSIYEKHVLFAFNNANQEAAFAINGWSSALVDERVSNSATVNDFVGINEANLGANKVNYYITRNLLHSVSLKSDGSITESLSVIFKNNSQTNSPLGGVYKNYLRFILPLNTSISSIAINGIGQKIVPAITDPSVYEKKGFIAPSGLEVDREDQGQNSVYGFLVNIQPQVTTTITVDYQLAQTISLSQPEISYNLKFFKQPGVDVDPYNFSFSFPTSFKVLDSSADIQTKGNEASLSTQISRDREVSVDLTVK